MTEDLALRPLGGAPEALQLTLSRELCRAVHMIAFDGKTDLKPETAEELAVRKAHLEYELRPIDRNALDRILLSLETMLAEATPGRDGELRLKIARHDLAGLPEFALKAAAEDFRRGIAGEGKFRPTVGELAKLTRLKAYRFAEEAAQIGLVLSADRLDAPPCPAEKARIAEGFRELRRQMAEAEAEGQGTTRHFRAPAL